VSAVQIETGQPEARHSNAPPGVVEWAADHGYVGTIDELTDAQAGLPDRDHADITNTPPDSASW
jgi:hypothetical protein